MSSSNIGNNVRVEVAVNGTDLPANVTQRFLSPEDGFVNELAVVVQVAVTTGGTLAIQKADGTPIAGLSVAIPNGAPVGTVVKAKANKGEVNRPCKRDDVLRLVPTGFATAGAVRTAVTIATNDSPQQPY